MNRQMIICSEEELYVLRLADMIADRDELDLQVQVCTSFEQEERLEELQEPELLVIGEEIPYDRRQSSRAAKRFVLVGQENGEVGEEETAVYKYQSASAIFSRIMEVCLDTDRAGAFQVPHKSGQNLIVVYSPIHRIGKSAFAKALGKVLTGESEVLYLNMQEYPGICGKEKEEALQGKKTGKVSAAHQGTLAELLYYSRQERNHLGLRLASMVKEEDGLDILEPIPVSQDLKEVEKEEWMSLILQILKKGPYQVLILDLSESVQGLFEILKLSDTWYLPYIREPAEDRKLEQFFDTLRILGLSKLQGKSKMVEMKGGAAACAKRALDYEKGAAYGKASGTGHGADGSVERNRRWRTGRIDLSGAGGIYRGKLSSPQDEDGLWEGLI